ncbi:MAG: hypothetical protein AAGK22_04765 [Acidobacteriota bacterium]
MDDDFEVGEPGEDDLVCDLDPGSGYNAGSDGFLEDVDGDLVEESQWFAFGSNHPNPLVQPGLDSSSCGDMNSPCATPAQAWANAAVWNAANPGAEAIVCVAGDFPDQHLTMPVSGLTTLKKKYADPLTNEQWEFDYPADPAMLVGVDADDDGVYPPVDSDDLASFTSLTDPACGSGCTSSIAWNLHSSDTGEQIEVAHVEFIDWGRHTKESGGILRQRPGSQRLSNIYVHDFGADAINKDQCHSSNTIMFNQFAGDRENVAIEYATMTDILGYVWRGGFLGAKRRYRGLDIGLIAGGRDDSLNPGGENELGVACDNGGGQGYVLFRIWGLDGDDNEIEMIDNRIEFTGWQNGVWESGRGGSGIALCGIRKFHIVGNRMVNLSGGLPVMTVEDNICLQGTPRFAGDWLIARNSILIDDYSTAKFNTDEFINVTGHLGSPPGRDPALNGTSGYFRVEDNEVDFTAVGDEDRLSSFHIWQQAPDGDHTGLSLEIVNNDIVGCFARNVGSLFWELDPASPLATPDNVTFAGNTVYAPPPCSPPSIPGVKWDLASSIATFSAVNNSFSHCAWSWAGVSYTDPAVLATVPGWDPAASNTCGNVAPILDNFLTCPGPDVLTLDSEVVTGGSKLELACEAIQAGNYDVTVSARVTMRAGESVRLVDGFRLEAGGKLTLEIDPVLAQ